MGLKFGVIAEPNDEPGVTDHTIQQIRQFWPMKLNQPPSDNRGRPAPRTHDTASDCAIHVICKYQLAHSLLTINFHQEGKNCRRMLADPSLMLGMAQGSQWGLPPSRAISRRNWLATRSQVPG